MRIPPFNQLFWGAMAVSWTVHAIKTPDKVTRAVYTLCMIVCLGISFLLKEIRERG